MGDDGFDYRLSSQWVGSGPTPSLPPPAVNSALPWGIRPTPSVRLTLGDFFTDFRLEGFLGTDPQTPLGGHYWDASPSSTISDQAPFSAWVYKPRDANDSLRSYFGIRQLTLGYRLTPHLLVRFGKNRYDLTESNGLMMANAYSWQTKFADVSIPLHWLGGELRYDSQQTVGSLRQLSFSAAAWNGVGDSFMGMGQGLIKFALGEERDAPGLTFTAYGSARRNPQPASGPELADPGKTQGEGIAAQFDAGILAAAVAYSHSSNASHDAKGLKVTEDRDVGSLLLDIHPGKLYLHGAFSFLDRAKSTNAPLLPATGQSEVDTELGVGYKLTDGLVLTAGYRGVYGAGVVNNLGFLGLTTSFKGTIPFSPAPSPTPR